jgi:hypothetical protein
MHWRNGDGVSRVEHHGYTQTLEGLVALHRLPHESGKLGFGLIRGDGFHNRSSLRPLTPQSHMARAA